jgi:hypothetical protein
MTATKKPKQPGWLQMFPLLALNNPTIEQSKSGDAWFIYAVMDLSVDGGVIQVKAYGHVDGDASPDIASSKHGSVEVMHMTRVNGGLLMPSIAGAHIPCPTVEEALGLAGEIAFNIVAAQEAQS